MKTVVLDLLDITARRMEHGGRVVSSGTLRRALCGIEIREDEEGRRPVDGEDGLRVLWGSVWREERGRGGLEGSGAADVASACHGCHGAALGQGEEDDKEAGLG